MKALDALGKLTDPIFGTVTPDDTVNLYFNLSQDARTSAARGTRSRSSAYRRGPAAARRPAAGPGQPGR